MTDKYYYDYDNEDDFYCYPGTRILKNQFGITNSSDLEKAESSIASVKISILTGRITGGFDLDHLKTIHKFIFEDIYDWAGELRKVDIIKGNMFCRKEYIESEFEKIHTELENDDFLEGNQDISHVAKRLSYYLSEINAIHPFREGNGRAQRVFCSQLCLNTKSFWLDFSLASKEEMIEASAESFIGDYEKMNSLISKLIKKL